MSLSACVCVCACVRVCVCRSKQSGMEVGVSELLLVQPTGPSLEAVQLLRVPWGWTDGNLKWQNSLTGGETHSVCGGVETCSQHEMCIQKLNRNNNITASSPSTGQSGGEISKDRTHCWMCMTFKPLTFWSWFTGRNCCLSVRCWISQTRPLTVSITEEAFRDLSFAEILQGFLDRITVWDQIKDNRQMSCGRVSVWSGF